MARTISYGMGQYRFTKNYNYITELLNANGETDRSIISYYATGETGRGQYRDILVTLPTATASSGQTQAPVVQYGQTYFLKLSVPQNRQYTVTLNLKLCPANTDGDPVVTRFQQIGRLEIPPTPDDDNIYSEVVLYQNPIDESTAVALIDEEHDESETVSSVHKAGEVYKNKNNGKIEY